MNPVDFLHHENPSAWLGVEPADLGVQGHRQTYTTQLKYGEFLIPVDDGSTQGGGVEEEEAEQISHSSPDSSFSSFVSAGTFAIEGCSRGWSTVRSNSCSRGFFSPFLIGRHAFGPSFERKKNFGKGWEREDDGFCFGFNVNGVKTCDWICVISKSESYFGS
ncbi:hypothetical protein TNCV_4278881 [Trichonephila clavipes]|nr:hypothetical protein TNCV_4278881 [Trichonephila clavipes]